MSYFNPTDLLRSYGAVINYAKDSAIEVYPIERVGRIPGVKFIQLIRAFDLCEAKHKAERLEQ